MRVNEVTSPWIVSVLHLTWCMASRLSYAAVEIIVWLSWHGFMPAGKCHVPMHNSMCLHISIRKARIQHDIHTPLIQGRLSLNRRWDSKDQVAQGKYPLPTAVACRLCCRYSVTGLWESHTQWLDPPSRPCIGSELSPGYALPWRPWARSAEAPKCGSPQAHQPTMSTTLWHSTWLTATITNRAFNHQIKRKQYPVSNKGETTIILKSWCFRLLCHGVSDC